MFNIDNWEWKNEKNSKESNIYSGSTSLARNVIMFALKIQQQLDME